MLFLGKRNRRKKKVIEDEESEVPHVEKTTNGLQMIIFLHIACFRIINLWLRSQVQTADFVEIWIVITE